MKGGQLIYKLGLLIATIISSFYLLMLGRYNVPALDDYGYIAMVEEDGLLGLISTTYNGWQCRFSTFFVNGLFWLVFGRASNLIWVTIIMLLSGWWVTEQLLRGILLRHGLKASRFVLWLVAVLTVNVGVLSFLEPATFYWLCALNYTISIWMTMLLVYAVFYCESKLWLRWILVLVSSIYISGTAENYTPLVIMVLGIVWLIQWIAQRKDGFGKRKENVMLLVSLVIMGIGFGVMLIGSGNKNRLGGGAEGEMAFRGMSLGKVLLTTFKASCILALRFLSKFYYYLLILPVYIGLGLSCEGNLRKRMSIQRTICVLGLLLLFFLVAVLGCVVGMGWYAPPRSFCYMSFVIITVCALLGVSWGASMPHKWVSWVLPSFAVVTIACMMVVMCVRDMPVAKSYHDYIVNRNAQIEERVVSNSTGTIAPSEPFVCEPWSQGWRPTNYASLRNLINVCVGKQYRYYEPQFLLMDSELSSDPNDWRNIDLKTYFHADFDIICIDSGNSDVE